MNFQELEHSIRQYDKEANLSAVERAYEFARYHHRNQYRKTGEPYFIHLHETALIAARMKLDCETVIAALLHDTVEDTDVTFEQLCAEFGLNVAETVAAVTKVGHIGEEKEVNQAETVRRILVATQKEVRVILVKLCDRLHNMRTSTFLPEHKRRKKALESLQIYAPLAGRLGIAWLRDELYQLAIRDIYPSQFSTISSYVSETEDQRKASADLLISSIESALDSAGIAAIVEARAGTVYDLWSRMQKRALDVNEVADNFSLLILVPTEAECYRALGVVHSMWPPVPGSFEDCVAMPRRPYSRSLKSSIILPDSRKVVLRIRTEEMNRLSTEGILVDKGAMSPVNRFFINGSTRKGHIGAPAPVPRWLKEFVEYQGEIANPDEFIQSVEQDLGGEVIATFTPKGETIRLPENATPIDFAFAVHPELGWEAIGCKVNGRSEALNAVLKNGDLVEIVRGVGHAPNKSWLLFCKTGRAKQSIRKAIRAEEARRAIEIGRKAIEESEHYQSGLAGILENVEVAEQLAKRYEKVSLEEVLAAVGFGVVSVDHFIRTAEDLSISGGVLPSPQNDDGNGGKGVDTKHPIGVILNYEYQGIVRLARCCRPITGERIKGLAHGRRGVSVHNCRCPRVLNACPEKLVAVRWDPEAELTHGVSLSVEAADRKALLPEICCCAAENGANITKADFQTNSFGKASLVIDLEVKSFSQCEAIIFKIEQAEGVLAVKRLRPAIVTL
jgi:GTP diphosphokinase / guanosine-3',5'-bis(diphosphate) 3'-diphosphatase